MSIYAIGTLGRIDTTLPRPTATGGAEPAGFADSLSKALAHVEDTNQEANVAVTGMLNKTVDVHDAMFALHEAEESLEITVAVRNKFVQAYQDIMRMSI